MEYKIFERDPFLLPFKNDIELRMENYRKTKERILQGEKSLNEFANAHEYFGFHRQNNGWIYREWAPNANEVYLTGDFNDWRWLDHPLKKLENGVWEIFLEGKDALYNGCHVKAIIKSGDKLLERIPLYIRRVEQNPVDYSWCGVIYDEPAYKWRNNSFKPKKNLFIYECHIGMAQEQERVGSYAEFTKNILPRVKKAGYNVLQIMAIMEHPYYGSFGYQVSSFFASSSRFGKSKDLKELIIKMRGLKGIIDATLSGCRSLEDMAEFFSVSETFIAEALNTYKEKYSPCTVVDNYLITFEPLGVLELYK